MAMIELSDGDLKLVKSALNSFLADFGHDEGELVRQIQTLLAKLAAVPHDESRASA